MDEKRKYRGRRRKKSGGGKGVVAFLLIAVSVMCVYVFVNGYENSKDHRDQSNQPQPVSSAVNDRYKVSPSSGASASAQAKSVNSAAVTPTSGVPKLSMPNPISINVSEMDNTHFLELVNLDHPVDAEPDGNEIISAWPTVPVITQDVTINKTALDAVNQILTAARAANVGSFYISSGYRDYADQKQTYNEAADKSYVQIPGHSEHETGLAADIMAVGVSQDALAASKQGQWLAANSWKYGLILRYPQGKQDVTGISYESWHFRYVGQPHAYYCYKNNLCLEEYIQFLKDNGGYEITFDNIKYSVFYETPKDGRIEVPEDLSYEVSDDNTGGYIVTAWSE